MKMACCAVCVWTSGPYRGNKRTIVAMRDHASEEEALEATQRYHPIGHKYRSSTGHRYEVKSHYVKVTRS